MTGDDHWGIGSAWAGGPVASPFPASLDRYERMQVCWETRDAAFFRGFFKMQDQRVVAKLFKSSKGERDRELWARRDYRVARSLRSAFAAKALAIETSDAGPIIIYADEETLPLATRSQLLALPAVLAAGTALALGLNELHREGLVHTNLNLDNVWLCPATGLIRIFDFGLSRHPSIEALAPLPAFERDPRFTAPEQTGRIYEPVSQRTDIYAFGIIFFWLITGRVPFTGNDAMSITDSQLTARAVFPREFQGNIPRPLIQLVMKCLEKSSDDRYASASGLSADLSECSSQFQSTGTIRDFALGRYDRRSTFRVSTRLHGRETETEMLRGLVRSPSGRPAILLVDGSPGVGKTAFLNQLADILLNENGYFVAGKFDQYRRNAPYSSLAQAFHDLIHQLLTDPPARLNACRQRLLAACEGCGRIITDVIPDFELIIGPQPPAASLPPLEARNRFNRVFEDVILALASGEQPLCLFMDDLQWADSASLEFLTALLSGLETHGLILVGAYRGGDVGSWHPLNAMITALENLGMSCQRLTLKALELPHVLEVVRDTLGMSPEEATALAEVLHSRTQGNPLYLVQLLHFLHDAHLIWFDYSAGRFKWDLQRIRAEAVTDSILDLLRMRIGHLTPKARHVLSTAACLGTTFEARRLACAAAQPDVSAELNECVFCDLIIAVDGDDAASSGGIGPPGKRFRFLHDRIQQAAFDLVPNDAHKAFRLEIGRRLLSLLTPEEKAVPQIDVLDNCNQAWQLIRSPREKEELARLNLVAGSKAREALAYNEALIYLSIGIRLLDANAWNEAHDLAFELHANAFECEYLSGAFAHAEDLFSLLIANATSKLALAKVYLTKILLDTSKERYDDAIEIGIRALDLFRIRCRRNPGVLHLSGELLVARFLMHDRSAQDLMSAPALTDPERIIVLKILVALFPTAYFLSPELLMFLGLKVVNYSLRHGISHLSATGFVLYGLVTGAVFGNFQRGYELGQFAVALAERGEDPAVICKVLTIFALFIKYWRDPLDESYPLIERARELALRAGDHQYVNYTIIGRLSLDFSHGTDLSALRSYCDFHERFVQQSKDAFPIESLQMWKSSILALTGRTNATDSLDNASYDERAAERRYRETGNLTLLSYHYTLKAQLYYLSGRYPDAMKASDQGGAVIASAPGQIVVADHYLYRGLAATAMLGSGASNRRHLRSVARRCLRQLNHFAANSPGTFLAYAKLLEADVARVARRTSAALKLYNEVTDAAELHKYPHLSGLANERAAQCCLADGQRRAAAAHVDWAKRAYLRWGASGKANKLDSEFPALSGLLAISDERSSPAAHRTALHRDDAFDIAAATAMFQEAAIEKGRERILLQMMERIRAQSGAETAYLVTPVLGTHRVEARAIAPGVPSAADDGTDGFSPAVINYVIHTRSDLIIDNPHSDARFGRCSYLTRHRPKSVMCTAIVKQTELLAIIYLEHGRMEHAFDANKLRWSRILSSEIGSALRGDRLNLYREYIHRFTPALVAEEIDADPDRPDLAVRERDVSILFIDLAGYTTIYELIGEETDRLVNRAFAEFIEEIHNCRGAVLDIRGDELLVVFQDREHEGHAHNAADAALAVSRAATRLNEDRAPGDPVIVVNMAINSGPAAVGLQPIEVAGGPPRWRFDATGMTVIIAARIREQTRNGNISVSAATAGKLGGAFDLVDMGEHSFKNVSTPVRTFRLLGRSRKREIGR
jgi:predicted ATPase/class 3 adenylate cyclase